MIPKNDPTVVAAFRKVLARGPMKSARLKVLLDKELQDVTGRSLSESYPRLSKFSSLLYACASFLDVVPPDGPGDISVSLRSVPSEPPASQAPSSLVSDTASVPRAYWLAFTNTNTDRRRFVDRSNWSIDHFLVTDDASRERANQLAKDPDFIEIKPVAAVVQSHWVQEFLTIHEPELAPAQLPILRKLGAEHHNALIRGLWLDTLGTNLATQWRRYRSNKVADFVRQWAAENGVPLSTVFPEPVNHLSSTDLIGSRPPPLSSLEPSNTRRAFHQLIDLMSEEELQRLQIPLAVAAKLIAAR